MVLGVSTDNFEGSETLIRQVAPRFPMLYSSGDNTVPQAYDVFDLFGDGLASASVFVIDKSGAVVWESIGTNYRHQVSAGTILSQLGKL